MKADVHGSCVSFSILKKETKTGCQIKLDCLDNHHFFSHINIAGSMGRKIDVEPTEEELCTIDEHLRRNIITDLNKSVVSELLQSDAEYLLVDFYDFGRVQWAYRGGSYTHTSFFNDTPYWQRISEQVEGVFRWIDLPTFLWYDKVDEYFKIMVEKFGKDHIILNRVYFSRYYIDKDSNLKEIRRQNPNWLGSYRDNERIRNLEEHVIEKFGIESVDVAKYFVADCRFADDILEVHYEEEYYHLAGRIISKIVRGKEEADRDKMDLESIKVKLNRVQEIGQGESEGYLSCAESPFHCYEPLDALLGVLSENEILTYKDAIIQLYEWVYREPEYFRNNEIPIPVIQAKLIRQFGKWITGLDLGRYEV